MNTFLFGVGDGLEMYLRDNPNSNITGIIDNDIKKIGYPLFCYSAEAFGTDIGEKKIYPADVLIDYKPSETKIIVTSLKRYLDIIEQLKNMGYTNCISYRENAFLSSDSYKARRIKFQEDKAVSISRYAEAYSKYPLSMGKIIFLNFDNGYRYCDHGKYITEKLIVKSKDIDIVWIVRNLNDKYPSRVRKILFSNWKQVIYEAETASVWIANSPIDSYFIKRVGQIYIQTKHWSSITLKKFYLDDLSQDKFKNSYDNWKYNSRIMDYVFSGSEFDEESCRRGFGFEGECVDIGSPRSDAMFQMRECKTRVCDYYGISYETKFILYAPTFRYADKYLHMKRPDMLLNVNNLLKILKNKYYGDWKLLLRFHPVLGSGNEQKVNEDNSINVSDYPDSQELASASDIMVSDYSSIMFEPAFVKKPVFLFAPDKKEYIGRERELLLSYDSLPFPIAETNEQLAENILNFDKEKYEADVTAFLDKYGVHEDGHASERAADFILGLLDKSEY